MKHGISLYPILWIYLSYEEYKNTYYCAVIIIKSSNHLLFSPWLETLNLRIIGYYVKSVGYQIPKFWKLIEYRTCSKHMGNLLRSLVLSWSKLTISYSFKELVLLDELLRSKGMTYYLCYDEDSFTSATIFPHSSSLLYFRLYFFYMKEKEKRKKKCFCLQCWLCLYHLIKLHKFYLLWSLTHLVYTINGEVWKHMLKGFVSLVPLPVLMN